MNYPKSYFSHLCQEQRRKSNAKHKNSLRFSEHTQLSRALDERSPDASLTSGENFFAMKRSRKSPLAPGEKSFG